MIGRVFDAIFKRLAPIAHARALGVTVGQGCRLIDVSYSSEPYLIRLGDRVSATSTRFETHDGGIWVFRSIDPDIDVIAPITVGDDVFLGFGVIVLAGVTIGSNVVVGAGAVVTRDIPDNSVAAGVPARVIGTIDDYRTRSLARALPTKNLGPREKRASLLVRFGTTGRRA